MKNRDSQKFFGKYRGKVENNVDPNQLGRLQVSCPSVLGDGKLSWAMPSTPFAGSGVGLFLLPPKSANVWVEFEGGDPDYPIWSGCFWGIGEMPASPAMEHIKLLKTDGVSIEINDMRSAGGLTIDVESPSVTNAIQIKCDTDGVEITIDQSKIKMTIEDINFAFGGDASTRHSADGIEMVASKSSVTLTEDSAEMVNDKASVSAAADTVTITGDSSEGKIGSAGVELTDGSGSANLSSGKLSVNDGALEVQ